MATPTWLKAAIEHIPRWIEFQMRLMEQPGCTIAIVHEGKLLLEAAFGQADLSRGELLTPRHRFRVASHSKSFAAAGVMKLREERQLRLDDEVGEYVDGLHPLVASATLAQLLSHTAGLVRDGADAGQWSDRRDFLDERELRDDLSRGPTIAPNSRFKYSNHGFGLVGLAIEAITGERFNEWILREIVLPSGLHETTPDAPLPAGAPFARGHSGKLPLGRRVTVPAENRTHALASATGFVSTAADLARFFGSLSPFAKKSVLSEASRREMTRRQWRDPYAAVERWYGLGTISGSVADFDWFGHSGGFQGTITRTACVPAKGLTISVLTNAGDGLAHVWLDGALHIVRAYEKNGAPSRSAAPWHGRWWGLWGALDLLPMDGKVLVSNPALANPMMDATEITPQGRDRDGVLHGHIELAGGFASHGESARLAHDAKGRPQEFWLAGSKLLSEARAAKELQAKYEKR